MATIVIIFPESLIYIFLTNNKDWASGPPLSTSVNCWRRTLHVGFPLCLQFAGVLATLESQKYMDWSDNLSCLQHSQTWHSHFIFVHFERYASSIFCIGGGGGEFHHFG